MKHGANILGSRFIICIINNNEEKYKVRFVVQGHRDYEKNALVHAYPTVRLQTVKMLLYIVVIHGFQLRTKGETQGCL